MDSNDITGKLIFYIGLVVLLTFHEFAHAWVAFLCGDDTARLQGRLSLNPVVHIDPLGTIVFPLLMIFSPIGSFLIGWAKPVPINLANFKNPHRDDVLVALAGPAMNLVLAVVLVGLARLVFIGSVDMAGQVVHLGELSLLLCFFNLIPIPPLDGSHVLRNFIGMSWETYWNLCRFGIIPVWIVMRIPFVQDALAACMNSSMEFLLHVFAFPNF